MTGTTFHRAGIAACLAAAVAVGWILWSAPERMHMAPFRESQTALSVRHMKLEGTGMLDYTTPVLGAPWRIPFELGLFQSVVARVSALPINEASAGRWVSAVFFALAVMMVGVLCRQLELGAGPAWWAAGVFALSPVHLGYGTAFMIESLALFLALAHLSSGLHWLKRGGVGWVALCAVAGALAAMVKGPTWAPAALVLCGLAAVAWLSGPLREMSRVVRHGQLVTLGVCLGVALGAGLAWVGYADAIKAQNPLAVALTSENLAWWNYGDWASKISVEVWLVIFSKGALLLFGPLAVLLPWALWRPARGANPRARILTVVVLGAGFLVAPLIFTNLHYRHAYYLWANGVYLIVAIALAVSTLPETGFRRIIEWGLPTSCLVTALAFVQLQRNQRYVVEDRVIAVLSHLPPQAAVAFAGFDWSAYIPYHAGVRALFVGVGQLTPAVVASLEKNRDVGYAAVVWQGGESDPVPAALREALLEQPVTTRQISAGVWIGATARYATVFESSQQDDPGLRKRGEVDALLGVHAAARGAVVHWTFRPENFLSRDRSVFQCGLRRGRDLFYFDSRERLLWRFSGYFS